MADLYRLFIKSDEGKTKVVMGHKDQHGFWLDKDGDRYYHTGSTPPRAEKTSKGGVHEYWTILDAVRTDEKVGK